MKKKYGSKAMMLLMAVSLLPAGDLGALGQAIAGGRVTPTTLKKTLSPQSASAQETTPTANIPSDNTNDSNTANQPTRPSLPNKEVTEAKSGFGYQNSIAGLDNIANGKITVIKDGKSVQSFIDMTDVGVRAALYYMYKNADTSSDWVLFIGGNVTLDSSTTAKSLSGSASESNMNFASLSGKIKSLTIVSSPKDNLSSPNTAAADNAGTISLPSSSYFGTDTVFRNITVSATSIYAQGNAMSFLNGTWLTGNINIFGGTDNSDLSNGTNLYFAATGAGNLNIYGGNATAGTINGDTHVSITGTSKQGSIAVLSAGNSESGTINGNTNLSVTNAQTTISQINGAGVGTTKSQVTVNGTVINNINSANSAVRYGNVWGGTQYGNISGSIYNTISGQGGWSNSGGLSGSNYAGGSFRGNIGTKGSGNIISNSFDSSNITAANYSVLFNGANSGSSQTYQKGTPSTNEAMSSGIVYADITSYLRAATGRAGSIYGAVGGNGHDASPFAPADLGLSTSTNTNYDPDTSDAKAWSALDPKVIDTNAQKNAYSAVYGNIYTWEQGGMMSTTAGGGGGDWSGYSYGGSSYGYVNGQTVLELGTPNPDNTVGGAGMVYAGTTSGINASTGSGGPDGNWSYSKNTRAADSSGWDTWGGGGPVWSYQSSYLQTGESFLIHQNDVARWTYGGNAGGLHYGDSHSIMNAGITDTLEGGGYTNTLNWGGTSSTVNNGQVNWFLSGGSWGDLYTTGNAQVDVHNGVINAIAGGNYGQANREVIAGNSTVNIYGGDFSGSPRTGRKQLSGGSFYGGSVLGNTTLNLDLTRPTGPTFKFPRGTYLSGGGGYNNNSVYTGSGKNNSITLNVATSPENGTGGILNGAVLYGDGTGGSRTNIGTINMNINADGSEVGSIYGTNYTQNLSYNTNINISDGVNITGDITSGGPRDNYTNATVANNSNQAKITLGNNTTNHPITISGSLNNFTNATVLPKTMVTVKGSFLNGGSATAATHAKTYSNFGQLTLGDNATLGISSASSVVSIGKLVVGKDSNISTPYLQSTGIVNLSDLDMSKGNLQWLPTGTPPTSISNTYSGAYWGTQKGFPVLTFNGGDANNNSGATSITPGKFSGIDPKTNYAFLGDYSVTAQTTPSSPTWIGYAVPGQIRVFNTSNLNDSAGNWKHSLTDVTTGTPQIGTAMKAWASIGANADTSEFKLMYVMGYTSDNKAPFSFNATAPGYIKSRSASRYDGTVLNAYSSVNPNFDVTVPNSGATRSFTSSDYFTGNALNGSQDNKVYGSYIINNVVTDNTTSLSAGNWIIHNDADSGLTTPDGTSITAAKLTQEQLYKLAQVKGVGVLSDLTLTGSDPISTDSSSLLNLIHQGIGEADYKNFKLNWSMGKGAASAASNLTVVPNAMQISGGDSKGQYALNAFDGSMSGDEAKAITEQGFYGNHSKTSIDNYTHALGIKADGTVEAPVLNDLPTAIDSFNNIKVTGPIPLTYSYNGLTKKVIVQVTVGFLEFTSAPTALDFGQQSINSNTLVAFPKIVGNNLVVTDTRTGVAATPWSLYVTQTSPLVQVDGSGKSISGGNSLDGTLYLNTTESKNQTQLSTQQVLVHSESQNTGGNVWTLNSGWGQATGKGISIQIPVERQEVGNYKGSLTWTLYNAPTN